MGTCQGKITLNSVENILDFLTCTIVNSVVPLLFALAAVGFIWGVIQMVINPDDAEKRKKGKQYMIWGIVALFVMVAMWGLVSVLTNTFDIQFLIPQLSQ